MSLFFVCCEEKIISVSFRQDSSVLTAAQRTSSETTLKVLMDQLVCALLPACVSLWFLFHSLYNISFSNKQVTRIKKIIIDGILVSCAYKFSDLTREEMYRMREDNWYFGIVSVLLLVSTSFRVTRKNGMNYLVSALFFFYRNVF